MGNIEVCSWVATLSSPLRPSRASLPTWRATPPRRGADVPPPFSLVCFLVCFRLLLIYATRWPSASCRLGVADRGFLSQPFPSGFGALSGV
jgi:hypothetical protein